MGTRHVVAILGSIAAAALFAFVVTSTNAADADADADVHMVNFVYAPALLTVQAGTTVSFVNDDTDTHTVSSLRGAFESGVMEKGGTWTYTFDTPGTFDYYCIPHPFMLARVIVQ